MLEATSVPVRLLPLLLSPIVGSFLGVLVLRLPAGRPVALGRSRCEACHRALSPIELVPLLSFVALRGRCRTCRAAIAPLHLQVELASVAVAAIATWVTADPALLWADCLLGWALLALAWIDLRHMRLPDVISLPLLLAGLAVTWLLTPEALTDHAAGAAAGYLAFRGVAIAYRALRGREGLGAGDAKLLGVGGAWLGLEAVPNVVLSAAVLAILVLLAQRRRLAATTRIPFGPALAIAIWALQLAHG